MHRYVALVGILISMHGFNSLKCSMTPDFLLIDHFLYWLATFSEKSKKICAVVVYFFNFSAHASSNSAIILAARCWRNVISKVEFN